MVVSPSVSTVWFLCLQAWIDKLVFNETMNMWATHNGIDIGAEDNAKVVAAMSGEVEKIDQDSSKICTVTLKHANDQKTIYNGLSSVSVKEGDKVSAGQELGIVGVPSFEAHDGLHLHFEYMIGNEYKNPEQFIAK